MTALTDALLAAWTAIFCALLFARADGRRPEILWACGFAATALGALAGAAFHCCRMFWKVVPIATGAAALCLGAAIAIAWLGPTARRVAITILILEFVACAIAASMSNSFIVAAADYLPVLVAILIACIARWRDRAARLIALGIVVAFVAIAAEVSSLRIGALDYNDLFHLIQMAAMFLLYLGRPRA